MIIHGRIAKSKKKLAPKSVREQYATWLENVNSITTNFSRGSKRPVKVAGFPSLKPPPGRETVRIPSKNADNMNPCVRPADKVYTGDKMLGIGTLHKSNAVPVFTSEEASDMAKMRR